MVSIKKFLRAQSLKFGLFAVIDLKAEFFFWYDEGRFRRLHSAAPCGSVYVLHMFATRKILVTVYALSVPAEGWENT